MWWRIYYGDYSTWDSVLADAFDVPGENVVAIVQRDDAPGDVYAAGRQLLYDKDFYWREEGRWVGGDLYGLFDYLRRPGARKVVAGRTVPRATYKAILASAVSDPDFPKATAG